MLCGCTYTPNKRRQLPPLLLLLDFRPEEHKFQFQDWNSKLNDQWSPPVVNSTNSTNEPHKRMRSIYSIDTVNLIFPSFYIRYILLKIDNFFLSLFLVMFLLKTISINNHSLNLTQLHYSIDKSRRNTILTLSK